ncbi:hypothetical protein [Galbitalea soli]|uniref:Uncharacterized protein n=1 Tax=Galbitalea soli TaxID=1268042 RepID=A0A7C9PPI4_9MICO|nr:hypothetical protein [Galbitalea soli]NEM92148.1 hypothetical protein [Galbitalea soli]NYJ31899.1 hypothetical protein [Galbitalea soli]
MLFAYPSTRRAGGRPRHRGRAAAIAALVAVLAIVLSGCAPRPAPAAHPLVGKTLRVVEHELGRVPSPIYDLSAPIVNVKPAFSLNGPQGDWVVVTACGAMSNKRGDVVVGIIPLARYTADLWAKAEAGGFDSLLAECSKR